jgi:riboflavin biosynthesis pyrimidine reductase
MVEPGPTLARSFLATPHVDRVWVFRSPLRVGDSTAPASAPLPASLSLTGTDRIGADELSEYRRPMLVDDDSDGYFAPEPSADFVVATDSAVG